MKTRHSSLATGIVRAAATALTVAMVASCSSVSSSAASADQDIVTAGTGDAWGPNILLRDDTDAVDGRPSGGWWVTAMHATLMPDGHVLIDGWGRADPNTCTFPEGSRNHGTSFLLDPDTLSSQPHGTLQVQPIDEAGDTAPGFTKDVLYCSGHVPIGDGRVLFVGGSRYQNLGEGAAETEIGVDYARVFDASQNAFSRVDGQFGGGPKSSPIRPGQAPVDKRGWHWYPTLTRMPDGAVIVSGGFTGGPNGSQSESNLSLERFDPVTSASSVLVQSDDAPAIADAMSPGSKDFTHTILLQTPVSAAASGGLPRQLALMGWNGRVLLADTDPGVDTSKRFALAKNGGRPGGSNGGAAAAWDSTSAMAPSGELMVMGGTSTPAIAQRMDFYDTQKATWRSIDTGIGRRNGASVLLPTGKILLMNGWNEDGNLTGDRRSPQIVHTNTGQVETFAPWTNDAGERGYHSFALLLKDGRVLIGGGIYPKVNGVQVTSIGCERADVRIYEPSYLKAGPRPTVSIDEPIALKMGQTIPATFGGALAANNAVVLMALGSFTHGFDQNQRYVPLAHSANGFTAPADTTVAPPGDYMLFVISDKGVPSVGKYVQLTP